MEKKDKKRTLFERRKAKERKERREDRKDSSKRKKEKNDSTSSKIDWSGSSNRWIGRSRSRDWNRIRSIDYWIVTKPIIGSEKIPIHDYGIRID